MTRSLSVASLLAAVWVAAPSCGQVFVSEPTAIRNGWSTFAILNRGEAIQRLGGGVGESFTWTTDLANWDGLGAMQPDADTLRVYVNHETSAGSISRIHLSLPLLQGWIQNRVMGNTNTNQNPRPAGLLEGMSQGWTSVGSGTLPIVRACSGSWWPADAFGTGRGFADGLHLAGEETFGAVPNGHFWVIDSASDTLYEAPDVGGAGSWESATLIDTGRTDTVALLLGEDRGSSATGTAALSLYVGLKNPAGTFLERNGLAGGTTYHWDANGTTATDGTLDGPLFNANDDRVTGTWRTTGGEAVLFSKAEDVATNMRPSAAGFGREAALASQNEAVFVVDCTGLSFVAGDLGASRESEVRVLFKAGTDLGDGGATPGLLAGMDNLVWSGDGSIYVNEDDGEGDVWRIDVQTLLAAYAAGDLSPNADAVFQILDADAYASTLGISESSGIIDISSLLGYVDGSVFLLNGMGSVADQLVMAVSPTAATVPEPTLLVTAATTLVCLATYARAKSKTSTRARRGTTIAFTRSCSGCGR